MYVGVNICINIAYFKMDATHLSMEITKLKPKYECDEGASITI